MVIYCMQCGKELPDDAKFCLRCGNPIKSTGAAHPHIPDNPWESVQPLWREWTRMEDTGESEEKRRLVEQQLIEKVLTIAKQLIDDLSAPTTMLSEEKFFDHCSRIGRELLDLYRCSPDWDEKAELHYQRGRLSELAPLRFGGALGRWGNHIIGARYEYEQAVDNSKRGSGRKLADYQNELAEFLQRWNLN